MWMIAKNVTFEGHPIAVVKHLKGLGSTFSGCYQQSCKDADARAVKAIDTTKRSKRTLCPFRFRKRVMACKMRPQLWFADAQIGCPRSPLGKGHI